MDQNENIKINKTCYIQLIDFLNEHKEGSETNNTWINDNIMNIYIRFSKRPSINKDKNNKNLYSVLDIANVSVNKAFRDKGIFTRFLNECLKIGFFDFIYVENVLDERFKSFFIRNECHEIKDEGCSSFYLESHNNVLMEKSKNEK